jgi:hypothetical protein
LPGESGNGRDHLAVETVEAVMGARFARIADTGAAVEPDDARATATSLDKGFDAGR